MKRIICILLIGAMVMGVLAGCQKDPESPIVVGKNADRMIEDAKKDESTSNDKSLTEQYGIPEEYAYETQGADGNLQIQVDASVTAPERSAMPIYRVKAGTFSQEHIAGLFDYFCGNGDMWNIPAESTKDDIQQMIIEIKREISGTELENDPDKLKQISDLEKAMQIAPDTLEETKVDADSFTKTVHAYEKSGSGEGRHFSYFSDETREAIMYNDMRTSAGTTNYDFASYKPVLNDTDIPAEVLSQIGLTPHEAREKIQALLDKTGSSMVVDSIYLQDAGKQDQQADGQVESAQRYAYKVYCVRVVDGIPCVSLNGGSEQGDSNNQVSSYWEYERLEFMLNSESIFSMLWVAPLETLEKVNQDSKLKPFNEVQEIFEKMMKIKYEATAEMDTLAFVIDRIDLSLHRVSEQNAPGSGLLIPVWNFYGECTHGNGEDSFTETGISFLSINAIDGSIIDISKGY